MNLLLLFADDFIANDRVHLSDRRFEHIRKIHRAKEGDQLTVGQIDGLIGLGTIERMDKNGIEISVSFHQPPPKALPVHIILALPRPLMLKRSLQNMATMGVKKISLIHTARVEKSFWQSPELEDTKLKENLALGLEQAKDTRMPEIAFHKNFNYFAKHSLPTFQNKTTCLIAHPGDKPCPIAINQKSEQEITLAIGPEGGFIRDEVDTFLANGFDAVSLGERILRVETAIPVLLARLFDSCI